MTCSASTADADRSRPTTRTCTTTRRPRPRPRASSARTGIDAERGDRRGRALLRRRAVVGASAPAAPASGASPAAASPAPPRRRSTTSPRSTRSPAPTAPSACTSRGTTRPTPARCATTPRRCGHRVRRDELEHVPGQPVDHRRRRRLLQVRHRSPTPTRASRKLAVEHNRHVIDLGVAARQSTALTVWLADGTNHPGPGQLPRASSSASPRACARSTPTCPTTG